MRATRLLAVAVGTLALGTACGGDGGTGSQNAAPTASFAAPTCAALVCTFTDGSTDSDGSIAARSWNFGDGTPADTTTSPSHTFGAAGNYTVQLVVTDNGGAKDTASQSVTVGGTPGNLPPTAAFTPSCASQDCSFADGSSDTDGTIAAWAWNFGDGQTSVEQSPTHHYDVAPGTVDTFVVALQVTDNGGATGQFSDTITVSPTADLQCENAMNPGEFANCTLDLTARATIAVKLTSRDCTAFGNMFIITAPVLDTIFTNACYRPPVDTVVAYASSQAFDAGTSIMAQFISGSRKQTIPPALHVQGSYPQWTLNFDDGEDTPADFDDIVLTVIATPVP